MSLSDEILARPDALRSIRRDLSALSKELPVRSAFLLDEAGTPFGAVGHVEFRFPSPLPISRDSASDEEILAALLGEQNEESAVMLSSICPRALLVVVFEQPLRGRRRRAVRARLRKAADALHPILESKNR
jgi:hypothetical protein